jgi:dTMP kinase
MSMAVLIAIEGIDGSGKGTQAQQLVERLNQHNTTACLLSFPRYSETLFGTTIGRFLDGDFGPLDAVAPELAATLYAGDRYESRGLLIDALDNHQVVVCDRYVPSNLAHQGSSREWGKPHAVLDDISGSSLIGTALKAIAGRFLPKCMPVLWNFLWASS